MENLGWDNSQTLERASSLWINNIIDQHHDHDDLDSLGGSNLSTDSSTILNPVQQQVMPPVLFGNSMELTTMSNFNFSNYNMVAKSEATPSTTNWGLFTSMINMPSNFDTILTKPSEQFLDHGFQGCTAQLDCLLSTTNSNHTDTTTTCIVYDGMCCCQVNETLSQSCSDPFVQTQITKCPDNNKLNLATNRKNIDQRSFNFLLTDSSKTEGLPKSKKPRSEKRPDSTNINFQPSFLQEPDPEAIGQMKEMIYRAAAFRPVNFGVEVVDKPQRKNVKISSDPQTVAARQRRERISERIRVLQRLVPGGNKMDTASMLDEAVNYVKFLKSQIKALEKLGHKIDSLNYFPPTRFAFSSKYPSFPML